MTRFPTSVHHHFPCLVCWAIVVSASICQASETGNKPRTYELAARDTLTVVQMNHGDVVRFQLRSGEKRSFVLDETSARIIERPRGGNVYSFDCRMKADGQPLLLRRYVCSQETFYEPWVVNGVRLWLSSSKSVVDLVPIRYPEVHHPLSADAIIVLQDATLPICPQPMKPWFPIRRHFIDVGTCYNGDDPWLGPYLGQACHVGLDINMPKGTPLYAPIDFDDHWIFSGGHRWRGVRRWPNGDFWGLQSHHVDKLLVEEHTKLQAGTHYAEGAGKGVGSHQHSHFEFRLGPEVRNPGRLGGVEIDPWILFWQIFETDRAKKGHLKAEIDPLAPAKTGQPVQLSASRSRAGKRLETGRSEKLRYYWTFGDGDWSNEPSPEHTFVRAGVYPVTLVVDDGQQRATHTQHITINGEAIDRPVLSLDAPDNVSFRRRPVPAADVYGWPVKFIPHTLRLTVAPPSSDPSGMPKPRRILLRNSGGGELPPVDAPQIKYLTTASGWLEVALDGKGNAQQLVVTADASTLPLGRHDAVVSVHCPGAINPIQGFRIELTVRPTPAAREVIVDDRDEGFYATPYFWVGHQLIRCPTRGYRDRYLTNGARPTEGEFVRFTPDLAAGRYEVFMHNETPLVGDARFPVRVRHASGEKTFEFTPHQSKSRSLGVYDFNAGTGGYVEFHAADSEGAVIADALIFRKVQP